MVGVPSDGFYTRLTGIPFISPDFLPLTANICYKLLYPCEISVANLSIHDSKKRKELRIVTREIHFYTLNLRDAYQRNF